jgi:hypothetical protein
MHKEQNSDYVGLLNGATPMKFKKRSGPLPPVRVRSEPPTVEEAVFAAQGLTTELQQQVELVAGLMELTEEEVRPVVNSLSAVRQPEMIFPSQGVASTRRAVIVERKPSFERIQRNRDAMPRR